jgi:hypothetical protein
MQVKAWLGLNGGRTPAGTGNTRCRGWAAGVWSLSTLVHPSSASVDSDRSARPRSAPADPVDAQDGCRVGQMKVLSRSNDETISTSQTRPAPPPVRIAIAPS